MPRDSDRPPAGSAAARAASRARREERRAKQRAQNVGRARLMHIARLEHEHRGDLHARAEVRSGEPATANAASLVAHVGCSGWYYWHWGGTFYPEDIPRTSWFQHYAGAFSTVELNAPFYSWPTLATVATWKKQTGEREFV